MLHILIGKGITLPSEKRLFSWNWLEAEVFTLENGDYAKVASQVELVYVDTLNENFKQILECLEIFQYRGTPCPISKQPPPHRKHVNSLLLRGYLLYNSNIWLLCFISTVLVYLLSTL